MTWRCVPTGCWTKASHLAARAFGVLVAAHPQPADVASCKCHMVWYPDAPAAQPLDIPAPTPMQRLDHLPPMQATAPGPRVVSAPWEDGTPPLAPTIVPRHQPTPAPEPATWTLFAIALVGLAWLRRRRDA